MNTFRTAMFVAIVASFHAGMSIWSAVEGRGMASGVLGGIALLGVLMLIVMGLVLLEER